jgi:phage shock protein PspC (stress-responsive transcriptional regulator)
MNTQPPPATPQGPEASATGLFLWIRRLGIVRGGREDGRGTWSTRWLAGVCSALGTRWKVHPILIRAAFLGAILVTGYGPPLLLYGLLWLFLPQPDAQIHAQRALHGRLGISFAMATIMVLVALHVPPAVLAIAALALFAWWAETPGPLRRRG